MIHQDLVDFQWADLLPTAVDDLFQPTGEAQIAFVIKCALIAGAEPAMPVRLKERFGIRLRVTFIAGCHIGARDHDLTDAVHQAAI
mgnify:CR=1 FL=1